jgi:hypothetical protein
VLGGVPVELDRRAVALIRVPRRAVEQERELVAVLLVGDVGAEAADQVAGGAHLGDRAAAALRDVVTVAAGRRGAVRERAAVDDRDVELARQRVGPVRVDQRGAREREHAAQAAGVLDVDRAYRRDAARPEVAGCAPSADNRAISSCETSSVASPPHDGFALCS